MYNSEMKGTLSDAGACLIGAIRATVVSHLLINIKYSTGAAEKKRS